VAAPGRDKLDLPFIDRDEGAATAEGRPPTDFNRVWRFVRGVISFDFVPCDLGSFVRAARERSTKSHKSTPRAMNPVWFLGRHTLTDFSIQSTGTFLADSFPSFMHNDAKGETEPLCLGRVLGAPANE